MQKTCYICIIVAFIMLKRLKKHTHLLHKTGLFLSVLCLIHCLATPFIITALPYIAQDFLSPQAELILIGFSIVIGLFVLVKDYRIHAQKLPLYMLAMAALFQILAATQPKIESSLSIIGSIILAIAYILNWNLHNKVCHSH